MCRSRAVLQGYCTLCYYCKFIKGNNAHLISGTLANFRGMILFFLSPKIQDPYAQFYTEIGNKVLLLLQV